MCLTGATLPRLPEGKAGLNSSPTEAASTLCPFISSHVQEASEAYLWWLLLDVREEHCLVVSVGTDRQESGDVFTAVTPTLKAK